MRPSHLPPARGRATSSPRGNSQRTSASTPTGGARPSRGVTPPSLPSPSRLRAVTGAWWSSSSVSQGASATTTSSWLGISPGRRRARSSGASSTNVSGGRAAWPSSSRVPAHSLRRSSIRPPSSTRSSRRRRPCSAPTRPSFVCSRTTISSSAPQEARCPTTSSTRAPRRRAGPRATQSRRALRSWSATSRAREAGPPILRCWPVTGPFSPFRDIAAERVVEQMKSDCVTTVSPELRTPLTSIYGFAETLLRQDVLFGDAERRTFLGYIASESARLTTIVDQLLNVARLDTGDLQVNLAPTDVRAVVSEVVHMAEQSPNGIDHDFVVDLPEEPIDAEADSDKLRQILANLVDNAVKFSPEGGKVTVAARADDQTVEVRVVDEGIGIPEEEQRRIFTKFYRGEAMTRDPSASGTGLGLFIAHGLVSAMGGRMWVDSREGAGSSFAFELPVARKPTLSGQETR